MSIFPLLGSSRPENPGGISETTISAPENNMAMIVGSSVTVALVVFVMTVLVTVWLCRKKRAAARKKMTKHQYRPQASRAKNLYSSSQTAMNNANFQEIFSPYTALLKVDPDTLEISKD